MNQMPYPNPNQGNQNPYQGNQNPYQGNPNPYQGNLNPYQGNPNLYQDNPNPYQGNPNPYQGNPNSYQGNPNPYQGNPNPYQGNPNPYQGNPNPYQGNPNPYQGYQNPYPMNQNPYPGSQGFNGGIKDPYAIKNRTAVLVMAFISLGCNLLGFIVSLFRFQSLFSDSHTFFKYGMQLLFSNFLTRLFPMASLVLLVLYLLAFHKKPKSSTLMVIAFWICAFAPLLICVMYLMVRVSMSSLTADILFAILYAVFFSLTAVDAAKGLSRKVFLILAFSVGMLSQLYDFIGFVTNVKWYIDYNLYSSIITGLIGVVGGVFYYLALLLFGLKNRIRPLSGKHAR